MDDRQFKVSVEFVEMVNPKRSYLIIKNEDDSFSRVFTGDDAIKYGKDLYELFETFNRLYSY